MITLGDVVEFFEGYAFNERPLILDEATTITNVEKLVKSHILYLKSNSGKKVFVPYFERLKKVYLKLKNEK